MRLIDYVCRAMILPSALLAGCTTVPRPIATSALTVGGDLRGNFQVLGIANRLTMTGNRPNTNGRDSGPEFHQDVLFENIPPGTQVIVPVISGWDLGFGNIDTDTDAEAQAQLSLREGLSWNAHHRSQDFGRARVDASVLSIDGRARTATVRITVMLSDDWQDDRWWGAVRYQLLYLGRPVP